MRIKIYCPVNDYHFHCTTGVRIIVSAVSANPVEDNLKSYTTADRIIQSANYTDLVPKVVQKICNGKNKSIYKVVYEYRYKIRSETQLKNGRKLAYKNHSVIYCF